MLEWWNSMTVLEQVFACIAIAATVVLVVQSILLLFGLGFGGGGTDAGGFDGGSDMSVEFDHSDVGDVHGDALHGGDGLSLFTVRGLVAFFAVGGWTGLALLKVMNGTAAILLAFLAGTAALVGIALLFKYAFRLQDTGNLNLKNAVGKTATVYIPIPANGGGLGKVTVLLQESLVELDAATKGATGFATGMLVQVCGLVDEHTVLVEQPENGTNNHEGGISKWIQS